MIKAWTILIPKASTWPASRLHSLCHGPRGCGGAPQGAEQCGLGTSGHAGLERVEEGTGIGVEISGASLGFVRG